MSDDPKEVPRSRLGRAARLIAMGARFGASRARDLVVSADETRLAEAAARSLGRLRGIGLKLGQMASYVDGMVPADQRETYEHALKSLRDAAPPMSPEAARKIVIEELGDAPESLFASFEPEPFASASIGQVHRARLVDGREVAVKVQYEGIEEAVRADVANMGLLGAFAGPLGDRFGAKLAIQELRDRFEEELDYAHEAEQQRSFSSYFKGDPRIRVPEVITDRSSRRVLTTELAHGLGFDDACARPEAERRAWAETMWRFQFESLVGRGHFHGDPHPGNYVFAGDGVVWFLDFGCTRIVPEARLTKIRAMHRAAVAGETERFLEAFEAMVDLPPTGPINALMRDYITLCFAPIVAEGGYRITHDYAERLMTDMRRGSISALRAPKGDFRPMPFDLLFLNRLQFGFYSVLARLDVHGDYATVHRGIVERPRGSS